MGFRLKRGPRSQEQSNAVRALKARKFSPEGLIYERSALEQEGLALLAESVMRDLSRAGIDVQSTHRFARERRNLAAEFRGLKAAHEAEPTS